MRTRILAVVACLAAAAALPACVSPDDSGGSRDSGTCTAASCDSYCRGLGRTGGQCLSTGCVCDGAGDGGGWDGYDTSGPTIVLTGKVWSPGHVVPISGAIVYFAVSEPAPIPPGAYPQACESPPSPYVVDSAPDGSFEIRVRPGTYWLTVQKGQFRRVTADYTVPATGPVAIDEALTTLPNRNDPDNGETIPHIALAFALDGGDHIEDVMAKVSLGRVGADYALQRGTEEFDIYNISGYPRLHVLLQNLLSYHIVFFPCTILDSFGEQLDDPTGELSDPTVQQAIRDFVNAGGKLYATDMMYDVFEQAMPEYLDICGNDATLNAGDEEAWAHTETMSGWTSYGRSMQTELSDWLSAIGIDPNALQLHENFVWIEDMIDPLDPDPAAPGAPKVWVEGDFALNRSRIMPLTVTWPSGYGKVLFSTYHTVGDGGHDGLIPQEYILLYLIMEIGICQDPIT